MKTRPGVHEPNLRSDENFNSAALPPFPTIEKEKVVLKAYGPKSKGAKEGTAQEARTESCISPLGWDFKQTQEHSQADC